MSRGVLSLKRKRSTIAQSCSILILDYWAAARQQPRTRASCIAKDVSRMCSCGSHVALSDDKRGRPELDA